MSRLARYVAGALFAVVLVIALGVLAQTSSRWPTSGAPFSGGPIVSEIDLQGNCLVMDTGETKICSVADGQVRISDNAGTHDIVLRTTNDNLFVFGGDNITKGDVEAKNWSGSGNVSAANKVWNSGGVLSLGSACTTGRGLGAGDGCVGSAGDLEVQGKLWMDGKASVPHGTDLPATCTTGEIFHDTDDDGCLDIGGGAGVLCQCKSTDTWGLPSGNGGKKVLFFGGDYTENFGTTRVRSQAGTQTQRFNFMIPSDYSSLVKLVLVGVASAGNATADIDLESEYGTVGEGWPAHNETDTTSTYNITANQVNEIDLSSVVTARAAGDFGGIEVDHNNIGLTMRNFGILLEYF